MLTLFQDEHHTVLALFQDVHHTVLTLFQDDHHTVLPLFQDDFPEPVSARYKAANDLSLQTSFRGGAGGGHSSSFAIDAKRIAQYKAKVAHATEVTLSVNTTSPEVTPRDSPTNE